MLSSQPGLTPASSAGFPLAASSSATCLLSLTCSCASHHTFPAGSRQIAPFQPESCQNEADGDVGCHQVPLDVSGWPLDPWRRCSVDRRTRSHQTLPQRNTSLRQWSLCARTRPPPRPFTGQLGKHRRIPPAIGQHPARRRTPHRANACAGSTLLTKKWNRARRSILVD